jgi:PAS domain S-box-containing protein
MDIDGDFYKCLLDVLYEGVHFMDRDGVIRYRNHGAERITGFSIEDVIGTACRDNILIHADGQGRTLCQYGSFPAMKTILDGQERNSDHFL